MTRDVIAEARALLDETTGHDDAPYSRGGPTAAGWSIVSATGSHVGAAMGKENVSLFLAAPVMRDIIAALLVHIDAQAQQLEALMSFARPFADALDIEADFMTPPAPFEDGFDVRDRAQAAFDSGQQGDA